eukprot:gene18678-13453_t
MGLEKEDIIRLVGNLEEGLRLWDLLDTARQTLSPGKEIYFPTISSLEKAEEKLLVLEANQERQQQTAATNLQELDFERTLEKEDFPPSNGGAVLFKRAPLVKRMVDTFTTRAKDSTKYSNFFFRHAAGTGKTVLLKLFGKELQQRGFVVFMVTALAMDRRPEDYFKDLADEMAKDGKQVAVLVDEVQRNVNSLHWDSLLKKAPDNLLVIGTGISSESPQFLD